jgi:hypothetical protein
VEETIMEWNFGEVILRAIENEKNRQIQDRQFNQSLSQADRHFDVSMGQRQQEFKQNLALNQAEQQFRQGAQFEEQKRSTRVGESQGWASIANARRATDIQGGYLGMAMQKFQHEIGKETAMNPFVDASLNADPYAGAEQMKTALRSSPYRGALAPQVLPMLQSQLSRAAFTTSNMQPREDIVIAGDTYKDFPKWAPPGEAWKYRLGAAVLPDWLLARRVTDVEMDPRARQAKIEAAGLGQAGMTLQGVGDIKKELFRSIGLQGSPDSRITEP